MNTNPAEMIDRWQQRAEPAPGEGLIYWHMLLGDEPEVVAMARSAQERLAPFTGLHMTPLKWLHMTALIAGSAAEITGPEREWMAQAAARQLAETPPITVTVGKVLYHPEAIMLAAKPAKALVPVLEAARYATYEVTGAYGRPETDHPGHLTSHCATAQPGSPPPRSSRRSGPGCQTAQSRSAPSVWSSSVGRNACGTGTPWQPSALVRFMPRASQNQIHDQPSSPGVVGIFG